MPDFSDTERRLIQLLEVGTTFKFEGVEYTVSAPSCKPTVAKGECKTDVYVQTTSAHGEKVFKISVKQKNADFLENKMSHDRAEEIFGENADIIITKATKSIKDKFLNTPIVFFTKKGHTDAKSITLGWKFEFVNKDGGTLSASMGLNRQQIIDVYSGTTLPKDKKNAIVNGKVVDNSGIADYILVIDQEEDITLADFENNLQTIEHFVDTKHPTIYFACKALNYRAERNKWDGNRPLSVYVDWHIKDGKLCPTFNFDRPLTIKGNEVGNNLKKALEELHIDANNFEQLKGLINDGCTIVE